MNSAVASRSTCRVDRLRDLMRRFAEAPHGLGLILAFTGLSFLVHGSVLSSWWTWDDPQLLFAARTHGVGDLLFSRDVWQVHSSANFTPLLQISFKLDLALFGPVPAAFYAHQLLVLGLTAGFAVMFLSRLVSPLLAFTAGVALLVSPMTAVAAQTLMMRHYVDGLGVATVALLLWLRERAGPRYLVAALYLIATLCKEVYAPLPLIFILIDVLHGRGIRQITVRIVPVAVAAATYLGWRVWMLGGVGGYGGAANPWLHVHQLPEEIAHLLFGRPGPGLVAALGAAWACSALAFALKDQRRIADVLMSISALGIVILLPLLPLGPRLQDRYAFAASAFLIYAAVVAADRGSSYARGCWAILTVAVFAYTGAIKSAATENEHALMISEGRHLYYGSASGPAILVRSNGWYARGIEWLRESYRGDSAPSYYLSQIAPVDSNQPIRAYRASTDGMLSLTSIDWIPTKAWDPRTRGERFVVCRDGPVLSWTSTAPLTAFLIGPDNERIPVRPSDWGRIPREYFPPTNLVRADHAVFRLLIERPGEPPEASHRWQFPRSGDCVRLPQ